MSMAERLLWLLMLAALFAKYNLQSSTQATPTYPAARAVKWTWYKGLRLVWNAASRFCHARGGNLPVLGTHLSMDAMRAAGRTYFNSTDKELGTVWMGLHSALPGVAPSLWERDCSVQPSNLSFWASGVTHDGLQPKCVRFNCRRNNKPMYWYPASCDKLRYVVCEFTLEDTLLFDTYDDYNLRSVEWSQKLPNTSSADDCESQCLQLSGASAECVAAVFEDPGSGGGGDCSVLLGDALLHPPPLEASVGSVAMVRNGFYYNKTIVFVTHVNYTFNLGSQTAREWLDSLENRVTMDNVSTAEDCVALCHGPNGQYANCVAALFVLGNDGICTAYYGQNLLNVSQAGVLTASEGSSVITASALLLYNITAGHAMTNATDNVVPSPAFRPDGCLETQDGDGWATGQTTDCNGTGSQACYELKGSEHDFQCARTSAVCNGPAVTGRVAIVTDRDLAVISSILCVGNDTKGFFVRLEVPASSQTTDPLLYWSSLIDEHLYSCFLHDPNAQCEALCDGYEIRKCIVGCNGTRPTDTDAKAVLCETGTTDPDPENTSASLCRGTNTSTASSAPTTAPVPSDTTASSIGKTTTTTSTNSSVPTTDPAPANTSTSSIGKTTTTTSKNSSVPATDPAPANTSESLCGETKTCTNGSVPTKSRRRRCCGCTQSKSPTDEYKESLDELKVKLTVEIKKNMTIDASSLSKARARKISAPDRRVSSQTTGYVAITLLVVVLGLIVLSDLNRLGRCVRCQQRRKREEEETRRRRRRGGRGVGVGSMKVRVLPPEVIERAETLRLGTSGAQKARQSQNQT